MMSHCLCAFVIWFGRGLCLEDSLAAFTICRGTWHILRRLLLLYLWRLFVTPERGLKLRVYYVGCDWCLVDLSAAFTISIGLCSTASTASTAAPTVVPSARDCICC